MSCAVVILIHKLIGNKIVSTIKEENSANSNNAEMVIVRSVVNTPQEAKFDLENYDESKVCLNFDRYLDADDSIIVESLLQDENNSSATLSPVSPRLNFPTLIKCQNCETNFPTKYQYQRHQCDFNSEKAVFKSENNNNNNNGNNNNDDNTDEEIQENGDVTVHECPICYKIFANKSNLERHQAGHSTSDSNNNICEFCGKHFVSENRLRIHKENHCKKAGDISKFYRSDVTVWKCKKCHEVFSSAQNANHHVLVCQDTDEGDPQLDKENIDDDHDEPEFIPYFDNDHSYCRSSATSQSAESNHNYIETISTEILLQCEFCNRTFSDKNLLLMHQRKHTTAKNYECVICNKSFDSYSLAASHWLKKCSDFANVFYLPKLSFCEYCDRTFKSHEILYNHKIKKKHYTPKLHIAINVEPEDEATIAKSTAENKAIINKLIQDVLKTLEVPIALKEPCNDAHTENNGVSSNGITAQIVKTEQESGDTSTTSSASNTQTEEMRSVNGEPEDATNKAPQPGTKRKWHKNNKMRSKKYCITTDEGFKYQCERCVKVFNCIVTLEAHRTSEHVATFCCEECGQTLGSAKALLIHCRAHKSLKPYVCDSCGRSYSQTSHLWQHMRFHQGIKPFACPHEGCEARYTIRPDLKDHIRKVHTRERPFKCNVCNKCFLTGSVYYQHRLIHTNDRRYGCEICHKRFFRADALNNHKRIHTDERPYPCTVCGREFRQKGDRNKHVRTQHPDHYRGHI